MVARTFKMVILFFLFLQTKEVLSFLQSRKESRKIAIDSPKEWGAHISVTIKGIHLRKTVSHLFSEKKYETIDLE